jgi:hypothetical protein
MRNRITATVVLLGSVATASAQYPLQQPGGQQPFGYGQPQPYGPFDQPQPYLNPSVVMPNIYNPATQPLSPYLFGSRGANPAVDYYFGTRPGTLGQGARGMGGAPFMAPGGNRMVFFPQLATAPDPLQAGITSEASVLPPAGHPVVFSNTLGFFPSPFGQAGGRNGLAGIGGAGSRK